VHLVVPNGSAMPLDTVTGVGWPVMPSVDFWIVTPPLLTIGTETSTGGECYNFVQSVAKNGLKSAIVCIKTLLF
jgi:hypothetical protein